MHLQAAGAMVDVGLPALAGAGESADNLAMGGEGQFVTAILVLAQGDEHHVPGALLLAVNGDAGGVAVLLQDVAVAPGVIEEGGDVVLAKAHALCGVHRRDAAFGVAEGDGARLVAYLIDTLHATFLDEGVEALEQVQELVYGVDDVSGDEGVDMFRGDGHMRPL